MQYIPKTFDMDKNQYILKSTNVYRSAQSQRNIDANRRLQLGGLCMGLNININN
jgi:hypothetical protein